VVAIRTNHGVWLPSKRFGAIDGESLTDLAMELKKYVCKRNHFWQKEKSQIWEITTDPETMPANSTWYVMTEIPGLNYKDVGNLYGCRNWVEYGLNQ